MTEGLHIEASVAIVGSGAAGALLAYKLAKQGIKNVVVLEAGPRIDRAAIVQGFRDSPFGDSSSGYPNTASAPRPDWNDPAKAYLESTGAIAYNIEYLRVVGGTTWHWNGCTPRLQPVDFRLFSTYGVGMDWPLSYEDLEPFYTEAEEEIGVAGEGDGGSPRSKPYPLPPIPPGYCDRIIAEGLEGIGVTFGAKPSARASVPYRGRGQCQGYGTCSPICPSGAQYCAIYHVERAEKLGVRVLDNTRVDKIVSDGTVTRFEAKRADGASVTVSAKLYVLAANGMETPRLLLMSANENLPKGAANSSGCVGRYLMEHPGINCHLKMPKPVWSGRGPSCVVTSSDFRDGDFRQSRPSAMLSVEHRARFHEIAAEALARGAGPPELDAEIKKVSSTLAELSMDWEQLPDLKNGITLNWDKRDSAGQPLMRAHYSLGDYERAGLAFAQGTFSRAAKALGAEILSVSEPIPQQHMMGMTRMGTDPKTSVTDGFGRSHDHKNLFILSAALFPSGGSVNPTLTIAALALRAAGEIARQLAG